jgi:hypothetical protein
LFLNNNPSIFGDPGSGQGASVHHASSGSLGFDTALCTFRRLFFLTVYGICVPPPLEVTDRDRTRDRGRLHLFDLLLELQGCGLVGD